MRRRGRKSRTSPGRRRGSSGGRRLRIPCTQRLGGNGGGGSGSYLVVAVPGRMDRPGGCRGVGIHLEYPVDHVVGAFIPRRRGKEHCSSPFLVLGMNALDENKNSYAFLGPFHSLDMRQFHTISCARELCQSKHAVSPLQGIHQTWEKNGGHTCRRSTKIYLLVAMFQRSGLAKWRQDLCGSLVNGGLCV